MLKFRAVCTGAIVASGLAISGLLMPGAWADTMNISNAEELASCVKNKDAVCLLTDDISLTGMITINEDVQINLNGHNIVPATNSFDLIAIDGAMVGINGTGTIGTDESWSPIRVYGSSDSSASNYSVAAIGKDVTLKADDYAIWVPSRSGHAYGAEIYFDGKVESAYGFYINGNVQDVVANAPTFYIGDGASVATNEHMIYAAGYGHWNIGEATLVGRDGLGIKAGTFILNDATVTATGEFTIPQGYGNGIYSSGTPIQIEAHDNYADNIEITINGGSYTSTNGPVFLEYKEKENTQNTVKSMNVNGGTFVAGGEQEIFNMSDNFRLERFISGGVFNKRPDAGYLAVNHVAAEIDGGYKVVDPNNMEDPSEEVDTYTNVETGEKVPYIAPTKVDLKEDGWFDGLYDDEGYAVVLNINKELIADRKADLRVTTSDELGGYKLANGGELFGVIDIKLVDRNGEEIEIKDNDLTVYIDISDEVYAELAKYDKLEVVYFDDEGNEAERLAAELKGEPGMYWIEFKTTHLSAYGVVGVNEAAATPETGTMTAAGASAATATIVTSFAVGILVLIASFAYLIRRR